MNTDQPTTQETTAAIFRRAAETLRAHVANVTERGPWQADGHEIYGDREALAQDAWIGETLREVGDEASDHNAAYIARMGPPVALALADWLNHYAALITPASDGDGLILDDLGDAVAVARAILREETP